ncbi:MAG: hypothetical protein U1A78_22870 [Polyangia bacterium]
MICDLLGVPEVDRGELASWSNPLPSMTQHTQAESSPAPTEHAW